MHRSGTSACTRVLNLLGCALPDEVWGAAIGNEKGHWESITAQQLNDDILASAGSSWSDWGPVNPDWRDSNIRAEMTGKAANIIADHAKLGPLFALKDPRICRLADVWLDAMEEAEVEPLILIILRNPGEVTQSLENRDLMSPGYGGLLWLRHVLDAEYLSRGRRRVHCTYDRLLTNWYGLIEQIKSDLGVSFPRNSPAVHAEIDAFLSHSDRHHHLPSGAVGKETGSSDWIRRTWAIFSAWSEKGENPDDYEALDAIRSEFDRSYGTFARLLLNPDLNGEFGAASALRQQLTSTISEAEEAAARAEEARREADAKLRDYAAQESSLKWQLEEGLRRAQELEAELLAIRSREPELTTEIEALQQSIEGSGQRVTSLESEIARLTSEAGRLPDLEDELEVLRAREPALSSEIESLRRSLDGSGEKVTSLEAEIARLANEAARLPELEGELEVLRTREPALTTEIETLRQSLESSGQKVTILEGEIARLAHEAARLPELEGELEVLRTREPALTTEIETLRQSLQGSVDRVTTLETENARLASETARLTELEGELEAAGGQIDTLQAQIASLNHEAARLPELIAQVEALKASEALLSGELATSQSSLERAERLNLENEADINNLSAQAARLPQLEAEIEALRSKEKELTSEISSLEDSRAAATSETESERERRQEVERLLSETERDLNDALQQLANHQGQLSVAQSTLAQRSEEIAQLSVELINAARATAAAESDLGKENAFRVDAERRLSEANETVAHLRSQIESDREKANEASNKLTSEVQLMTRLLRDESSALAAAKGELAAANTLASSVQQENAAFLERLRESEAEAKGAVQARAEAESQLAQELQKIRDLQWSVTLAEQANGQLGAELTRRQTKEQELEIALDSAREARDQLERKLAKQYEDSARLTTMLSAEAQQMRHFQERAGAAEQSLVSLRQELAALADKNKHLEENSRRSEDLHRTAEQKLAGRFNQIATLTSLINGERSRSDIAERKALWLQEFTQYTQDLPKWWAIMPKQWQRNKRYARYRRQGLFDREQYLRNNPDVADVGMDALTHYILHGLDEGRSWESEG